MIATRLEDEPEGGGGLVAAAQAPRFLGAAEELDGGRIVGLGAPARADLEQALEGEAEGEQRTDRDGQCHGRGDSS